MGASCYRTPELRRSDAFDKAMRRLDAGTARLHRIRGRDDGARTCAVVGSSGNLVGSALGASIDSHDVVIRMNDAPAADSAHEVDVGKRTTLRLVYAESASSAR